jgi:glycosyltransferase involved in cell wall biosynthesis
MKISIAVPSFNYGRYLGDCLESIRTQSHRNFEVLLADGGSSDGSLAVIEAFCAKDPRFRLVSRHDEGQADAVNKALKHASGDVFCFLNADDLYISENAFAAVVAAFSETLEVDVVTMGGWFVDSDGVRIRPVRYRYHPLDSMKLMKYRTAVLQPATFWKNRVSNQIEFDATLHYAFDVFFFYAAWMQFKWRELDLPIAGYRWHGENKSACISEKRIRELAALERYKFGVTHWRGAYLDQIANLVEMLNQSRPGRRANQFIRLLVNGIAYAFAYRVPSI